MGHCESSTCIHKIYLIHITDKKVFADIRQKYFGDKPMEEMAEILEKALEAWFRKEGADV